MKPAIRSRRAELEHTAAENLARGSLARLAVRLLIDEVRRECETFIKARDLAIYYLKRGLASWKEIYIAASREFVEHMGTLASLWRQIDSRHAPDWDPQMAYSFARRVLKGQIGRTV